MIRTTVSAPALRLCFQNSIHLLAIADVDNPDEVGDLVVERVVALHVDEGIPLHVIPLRTPERVRAASEMESGQRPHVATRALTPLPATHFVGTRPTAVRRGGTSGD